MYRLFVAVDLPDAVKDQLTRLCSGLAGVRWVGRDQMHLTLRFIGEVDETQYESIKEKLAAIQSSAFEMRLNGIGQFPPKGKPRVVWVGVQAPSALNVLQGKVERAVVALGLPPEDRPFSAHITLARVKTPPPPDSVQAYFIRYSGFCTEAFPVEQFILYSSHLAPSGASYKREGVYGLKG